MGSRGSSEPAHSYNSVSAPESEPFLSEHSFSQPAEELDPGQLEGGTLGGERGVSLDNQSHTNFQLDRLFVSDDFLAPHSRWPISSLIARIIGRRNGARLKTAPVDGRSGSPRRFGQNCLRRSGCLLAFLLMFFGIVQVIALVCGLILVFFPNDVDWNRDPFKGPGDLGDDLGHWPTDATADIAPVACHSHNDYWRRQPLFSAIKAGCVGVEADVWLFDDELFVGHSTSSLTPKRTLRSLYIDPILQLLDKQNPITTFHPAASTPRNGVFDTDPSQQLILLIDFKTDGEELWDHVNSQLEPLRQKNYLTCFNGTFITQAPVTVVVTGNAPFNRVIANSTYRDMFFDAPLDLMTSLPNDATKESAVTITNKQDSQNDTDSLSSRSEDPNQGQGHSGSAPENPIKYTPSNSYYASVSFKRSIGIPWRSRLTQHQLDLIRQQIAGAHAQGLKVRYWGVPAWPRGLRNYLWRVLVQEGVDYLSVDDLRDATSGNWGRGTSRGWWISWSIWS